MKKKCEVEFKLFKDDVKRILYADLTMETGLNEALEIIYNNYKLKPEMRSEVTVLNIEIADTKGK